MFPNSPVPWRDNVLAFDLILVLVGPGCELMFAPSAIAFPSLEKTAEAVPGVVPYFCATSLNSPLSWPPPSLVSLLFASIPCFAIVDAAPVIARLPAAVPGAGCVACRASAPGLPTSSPMPRGPPPRAPAPFPGFTYLTEIDRVRIPLRPSAPPRHPAPASMSVGRHRARGFPPGQSLSPPIGAVPRPPLETRLSA